DWSAYCGYLEGQLMMAQGDYLQASQRFQQVKARLGSPELESQAEQFLMECYNALGKSDQALNIASNAPNTLRSKITKAAALASRGKTKEALALYQEVKTELDKAGQTAAIAQVDNVVLRLLIAQQMDKAKEDRDWTSVDSLFTKLRQQGSLKEPTASLMESEILVRKGENDQARQLVQHLLPQYPNDVSVITSAALSALQNHN